LGHIDPFCLFPNEILIVLFHLVESPEFFQCYQKNTKNLSKLTELFHRQDYIASVKVQRIDSLANFRLSRLHSQGFRRDPNDVSCRRRERIPPLSKAFEIVNLCVNFSQQSVFPADHAQVSTFGVAVLGKHANDVLQKPGGKKSGN
jgi:hypothetical protein